MKKYKRTIISIATIIAIAQSNLANSGIYNGSFENPFNFFDDDGYVSSLNWYQNKVIYDNFGDTNHETIMSAEGSTLNIVLSGNYGNLWYNQDLSDDLFYGCTDWVYPLMPEKYTTIVISTKQDLNFTTSTVNYYRAAFVAGSADFIFNQENNSTFRVYFAGKGQGQASLYGGMLLEGGLNGEGGVTINGGNAEFIINTDTNGSTTPVKYWKLIGIDDGGYATFKDVKSLKFSSVGETDRPENPARAIVMYGGNFNASSDYVEVSNESSAIEFYDFVRMYGGTFKLEANSANLSAENLFHLENSNTIANFTAITGNLKGNISSDTYAKLNISLGGDDIGSLTWTGQSSIVNNEDENASCSECGINLTLKPNSIWNMTSSSKLTSLTFGDITNESTSNSIVDFVSQRLPGQEYSILSVSNLNSASQSGRFILSTDITGDSDIIEMKNGEGTIQISFSSIENSDSNQNFSNSYFAHQTEGVLTINGYRGQVSARGSTQTWQIAYLTLNQVNELKSGLLEPIQDPVNQSDGGEGYWYLVRPSDQSEIVPPEITDNITIGTSASQALAYMADLEDLRKRLGEVRYGAQAGAWVKAFAKKDNVSASGNRGFEQDVYGINVGLDTLVGTSESASWLVGGAFRYARADQEGIGIDSTSGDLDEYSIKAYATWMHEKGSYADFVLQAGRYEQELNGLDNTGTGASHADYGTWGFGASIEIGHTFSLADDVDDRRWFNHFFIEPQLELSYFHARGADYSTSTGLKVSQDNADFLTGRAGLVLGKKFNYGTEDELDRRYFQLAVIGGVKHEFLGGDQTIRYTGVGGAQACVHADDIDGTRFYYGLNFDWQVSDSFRLYAQFDREEGDHYTKEYDVSVGAKWSF